MGTGLTDLVDEEGAVGVLRAGAGHVGCGGVVALEESVGSAGLERLDQLRDAATSLRRDKTCIVAMEQGMRAKRMLHLMRMRFKRTLRTK